MGILLASRGLAFSVHTASGFCVFINGIAVDRSGRFPVGASRGTVFFAYAFACEMIPGNTGFYGARSVLANAR